MRAAACLWVLVSLVVLAVAALPYAIIAGLVLILVVPWLDLLFRNRRR